MTVDELLNGLNLSDEQLTLFKRNLATVELSRLQGLQDDVARAEEGSIMTRKGLDLLAKGIAGKQLKYTRVAIGDSMNGTELIEPTDAQILEMTDLVHACQDVPIVDCKFAGNGTMVVQSLLQNADFEDFFWFRELGLFCEDPDDHEEYLYSYRNTGLLSPPIPSGKGAVLLNFLLNLVTVIDNATNIVAVMDASLLYVTQAQLIEHINSLTPHPNIPQLKDPLTTSPLVWANDQDNHLHPMSINDLAAQIFQLESGTIDRLGNRIAQVETNVANLFMQIASTDANLLIAEDFSDCQSLDTFKVKVLNTVGGPNDVYVENLDGIIAGHYYTLSDGSRSLYLRARSLATNGDLFNVMFDSPVTSTLNLNKAYLYRTTAIIEDNHAAGSSLARESVFAPDDVWQGVASSVVQTITLNTKQANAANFTLSGDASFTTDGFFTLA